MIPIVSVRQYPVLKKPFLESGHALFWMDHSSGCPGVEIICEIGEVTSDELCEVENPQSNSYKAGTLNEVFVK